MKLRKFSVIVARVFGLAGVLILFFGYPEDWRRWFLLPLAYVFIAYPKGWWR